MGTRTGNPTWQDKPSTATPISAAALNNIESAIDASSGIMTGTGSPYGTVTPVSAGIKYIDTTAALGALEWTATGTSNTSWVVTYGDTGWRDVTSLIAQSGPVGRILLRRNAGYVTYLFDQFSVTAASLETLMTVPSGFEYECSTAPSAMVADSTQSFQVIGNSTGGVSILRTGKASPATKTAFTYPAKTAWPTSLPGTAAA